MPSSPPAAPAALRSSALSGVDRQASEQKAANLSAEAHRASFAGHRAELTALVSERAPTGGKGRLCVLGAGNCHDLDLEQIGSLYSEIHLVDMDLDALERASERQSKSLRARLYRHPIDLTGLHDRLDRWERFKVSPEELMHHPETASSLVSSKLPGPFDVVLSACVLSQMQLLVYQVLTSTHRLFEAVRQVTGLVHLRTLARLIAPGGSALLATDVASDQMLPLASFAASDNLAQMAEEALKANQVIYAAHPALLGWMAQEDPYLRSHVSMSPPLRYWLWHNGPERIFLVYALEMIRRAPGASVARREPPLSATR